jgi:hypothetical protein
MIGNRARVPHLLPPLAAVVVAVATACSNGGGGGATGGFGDTGGGGGTGGTGGVEPIVVTVTPTPTGVLTCSTTQFSATIAGTADTSGTWSMAPATGAGTISIDGLYTAPTATPAAPANSATVTATSAADPSAYDTTPAFTLATAFPGTAVPITGSTGDLVTGNPGIGIYQHAAASSGKTVYATWTVDENTAGEVNMMVARSLDGGATWGTPVEAIHAQILDAQGGAIGCPAVAIDAGNANVVYAIGKVDGSNSITDAQGDITNDPAFVLSVSVDGGQTFTETVLSTSYSDLWPCADVSSPAANTVVVTAPGGTDCGVYPDMYVWSDANRGAGFRTGSWDQNHQWWADGLNASLYILKGTTSCTTDLAEAANSGSGASGQVIESPRMFTDGKGHLCLAYAATPQIAGTIENVYVQCSPDGGLTFAQPVEIDPALGIDNQPVGAFGPGGLAAVAWVNVIPSANDQQLYLAVSTNAGATFGAPIFVSTPAIPYSPSVYVDASGIIWISYMVADGASYALMVDKSCDNGVTFSGAVEVKGTTSFGVLAPALLGTGAAAPILVGLEDNMHVAYSLAP